MGCFVHFVLFWLDCERGAQSASAEAVSAFLDALHVAKEVHDCEEKFPLTVKYAILRKLIIRGRDGALRKILGATRGFLSTKPSKGPNVVSANRVS